MSTIEESSGKKIQKNLWSTKGIFNVYEKKNVFDTDFLKKRTKEAEHMKTKLLKS